MTPRFRSLLLLLLAFASVTFFATFCASAKRVEIPDELDDVTDDEEDASWRAWGVKKAPSGRDMGPPLDFDKLRPDEIQAELARRHTGPVYGFVKLRPGVRRSVDDVPQIAEQWSKVLRTGSIEVKFIAIDTGTIMFTMEEGRDLEELKEFVLSQPEAYEMKLGEQTHRRPGDPPIGEVIEKLQRRRKSSRDQASPEPFHDHKDEL